MRMAAARLVATSALGACSGTTGVRADLPDGPGPVFGITYLP